MELTHFPKRFTQPTPSHVLTVLDPHRADGIATLMELVDEFGYATVHRWLLNMATAEGVRVCGGGK